MLVFLTGCNSNSSIPQNNETLSTVNSITSSTTNSDKIIDVEIQSSNTEENLEFHGRIIYNENMPLYDNLYKFEQNGKFGFKDNNNKVVTPAIYDFVTEFNNEEKTAVSAYIKNENTTYYDVYYIDKTGQPFYHIAEQGILESGFYTDFYNGYAFYEDRFIDERGNTVFKYDDSLITYWGNNYFESYYMPSINGQSLYGHNCLMTANGKEELSSQNIYITELVNGYVLVNSEKWCAVIDENLDVKTVYYNISSCSADGLVAIPCWLTDISFSTEEGETYLKVRKGFKELLAKDESIASDNVQEIFKDHYDPTTVKEFYYSEHFDLINRDNYLNMEEDFQYELTKLLNLN